MKSFFQYIGTYLFVHFEESSETGSRYEIPDFHIKDLDQ